MFTLGTVIHSFSPIAELLLLSSACVFTLLVRNFGGSRDGACLIGYSLAAMMYLTMWGTYQWDDYTSFLSADFWIHPRLYDMLLFLASWVLPWPLLWKIQFLIRKYEPQDSEEKSPMDCTQCSYPLAGISSLSCPECGREFKLQDPSTTSSDSTQTSQTMWLYSAFKVLHQIVVALLVLSLLLLFVSTYVARVFVLPAIILTSLLLLVVQTCLALKVFGLRYALGHLVLTAGLSIALFLGVVLVPFLVMNDVVRKWKTPPQPSQATG